MKIVETPISGVFVIKSSPIADERGMFSRFYCENELATVLDSRHIVQINYSRTKISGTVRGFHFQYPPYAELKCIRCLRGKVWDVAVDLRAGSPTFLKWHAVTLTQEDFNMMVLPEGCAHGYQTLEADSELLYFHTAPYMPASEGGIRYDDQCLAVTWPLAVTVLSERDRQHPVLTASFSGIVP